MTSGRFSSHFIASIQVASDRQRQDLGDVDSLAESMQRIGLINPIVIDKSGTLVAGERRLTAARLLGWTSISVQFVEDLSPYELQCIELEENVKRKALTWQEECAAIERFHLLKVENEPSWDQGKTAEALGLGPMTVSRQLAVAKELDNVQVANSEKFSKALNLVSRSLDRRKTSAVSEIGAKLSEVVGHEDKEEIPPITVPLLNASFHDWQQSYSGPRFNLIHCDFPYGINVANSPRQNAALQDHYEDGFEVYQTLLGTLHKAMDNVIAESAHLLFWFSMDFYEHTRQELRHMGWTLVNPFPLIWHKSDNSGIAPDTQRWPRRTYETAFIASRGDRKLTSAGCKANSFAFPGSRDGAIHISEKPVAVLTHFLSMYCDEYSSFLDPTCGSGNAVKVAQNLGASTALGIEIDKDFYDIAVENWNGVSS